MLYMIIVLIILVLFLLVRLILIKKELKRVTTVMKDNPGHEQMNMDFVDRDLQRMIAEVNKLYAEILKICAESKADENKLKESVSVISHDMRTPLTSIIGYLQVAVRSDDSDEIKDSVRIALERARYLNELVNDFFELSLIESDQVDIRIESVNLSGIICEEILAESPQIDRKGLEPVFAQQDKDFYVKADAQKLTRVIQNLISNAVKYSNHRLEFTVNECEDGTTELKIITDASEKIDTGKIFDRFYQNDSSRTKGGAGLGLYICKSFVEMMDGSISAKQEGSVFEILLTLNRA
ncbi:MAG: HAMP domain-containing histidine kinase [Clostridiales bacterium]|nr:HAMP domain-containing histidine kinase [Clostridiales bacterium]